MGAVAVIIHGIIIIIDKIPAVYIIDITVAVVIDIVAGNFSGIGPDIVNKVFMIIIDTCIDYSHQYVGAGFSIPCFGCVNVGIGRTTALTAVVHTP